MIDIAKLVKVIIAILLGHHSLPELITSDRDSIYFKVLVFTILHFWHKVKALSLSILKQIAKRKDKATS